MIKRTSYLTGLDLEKLSRRKNLPRNTELNGISGKPAAKLIRSRSSRRREADRSKKSGTDQVDEAR